MNGVAASLAITMTWVAVSLDALFGSSRSAIVLACLAFLSSWAIARYAFRRDA